MIPFISRDDLSDYMRQDISASDIAGIVIDAACETVRTYIGRRLNYVEDDEITLDGSGTETLMLPEWPVIGTPVVEEDGVAFTDFVVRGSRLVRTSGIWMPGVATISVTYSHGYATSEADVVADTGPERVPSDLRDVALVLAAMDLSVSESRFNSVAARDTVGGATPQEGPGPPKLTAEQERTLHFYRPMSMA